MKRNRLPYWFALCCLASVLGCAPDAVPTTGNLLITVPVPEPALPFFSFDSMQFAVTCGAMGDGDPVAEGELEMAGEDVTDTGATVALWQALVEGLPPGDCRTAVLVRDDEDEVICVSSETVPITAGEVTESRAPLVCSLAS